VRLLKYGDSLYRCKELKRAAMVRRPRAGAGAGGLRLLLGCTGLPGSSTSLWGR